MRASYSRDTAAAGTRVPHWVPMPKSTKKKGRRSLAAPASAPADLDEDGKALPPYTITVNRVSTVPTSQRANRIAPTIQFSARLAGAIHYAVVNGNVTV